MEHGVSWFNFIPGYQAIEHFLAENGEAWWGGHAWLFGRPIVIQHSAAALLVALLALMLGIAARRDLKRAPDGGLVPEPRFTIRNAVEVLLESLYRQAKQIIGDDAARFFPVIAALATFILISNLLGLIPGFIPPTDNWNTTFACGGFVFLYYHFHGLRVNGLAHLAHLANPSGLWWGWFMAPLMLPIEVVSHVARPFSLGVRLATNMVVDHALVATFLGLVPYLVPIPFLAMGVLVSFVQTLVFVLLTMVYIGLAVEEAHHDEHHHGHEAEPVAA